MESAHEDEANQNDGESNCPKRWMKSAASPLSGSRFEDEAQRRSRANNNDAEVARLLRDLERVAKSFHSLRGCGRDPKGAWPDC
jgi:hypothetical protein